VLHAPHLQGFVDVRFGDGRIGAHHHVFAFWPFRVGGGASRPSRKRFTTLV
jgi:hypothetical protein